MISRREALLSALALGLARPALAESSVTIIKAEDGRDVRVTIWPATAPRRGTILFSHGAMSAPEKYQNLLGPWSAAGYEILAPLHIDSTDHPDNAKYPGAGAPGSLTTWAPRLRDMKALSAFVDAPSFIAAGHSYGGLVALTLGGAKGEVPAGMRPPLGDPRAKMVVAFSPPGAVPGKMTREGYAALAVPAFVQTGDQDNLLGMPNPTWQAHLTAYDMAPPGDKYALVLAGVDHYFGGLICEADKPGPPRTAQLAQAVRLSLAFMKAYGGDAAARRQLDAALAESGPVELTRK